MQLFYVPGLLNIDGSQEVIGTEQHHIVNVLRHKTGDEIYVTNGKGGIARVIIEDTSKKAMKLSVVNWKDHPAPYYRRYSVVLGLIRQKDRMEYALEKCVEVGLGKIVLIVTDHSEGEKVKMDRYQGIIEAAMKQSLQCFVPEIEYYRSLDLYLNSFRGTFISVAHEKVRDGDFNLPDKGEIAILTGPPGGFSQRELLLVNNYNANIVSLGPTRLRSETAAVVHLARIHRADPVSNRSSGITLYNDI